MLAPGASAQGGKGGAADGDRVGKAVPRPDTVVQPSEPGRGPVSVPDTPANTSYHDAYPETVFSCDGRGGQSTCVSGTAPPDGHGGLYGVAGTGGDAGIGTSPETAVSAARPLALTTTNLPGAQVGAPYAAGLSTSGGTGPLTYRVSAGSLPPGLRLDTSTGAITGTPTASGTAAFTIEVTDSSTPPAVASQALTINTSPAGAAPSTETVPTAPSGPAAQAPATSTSTAQPVLPSAAADGPAPASAAAQRASLVSSKPTTTSAGALRFAVRTSSAGRLKATATATATAGSSRPRAAAARARRLVYARATIPVGASHRVVVVLKPSARARELLARTKRLRVRIALDFAPEGAAPLPTSTQAITVKRRSAGRGPAHR